MFIERKDIHISTIIVCTYSKPNPLRSMVALFLGYDVIKLPKKADRAIWGQKGQISQNFVGHLQKLIAPIDSAWSITLETT